MRPSSSSMYLHRRTSAHLLNERTSDSPNEADYTLFAATIHVDEHLRDGVGLLDEPPEIVGRLVERAEPGGRVNAQQAERAAAEDHDRIAAFDSLEPQRGGGCGEPTLTLF